MRTTLMISALAFGLVPLAPVAFAQAQTPGSSQPAGTTSSGSQAASQTESQTGQSNNEQSVSQIMQSLQSDLQQKGYQDVKVLPETFMITATKDGQPVLMLLSPGSVTSVSLGKNGPLTSTAQATSSATSSLTSGVTESSGSQATSSEPSGTSGQSGSQKHNP